MTRMMLVWLFVGIGLPNFTLLLVLFSGPQSRRAAGYWFVGSMVLLSGIMWRTMFYLIGWDTIIAWLKLRVRVLRRSA